MVLEKRYTCTVIGPSPKTDQLENVGVGLLDLSLRSSSLRVIGVRNGGAVRHKTVDYEENVDI